MSYTLRISPEAVKDLKQHKKSGDKKLLRKIANLLIELQEHPRTGSGQPEKSRYELEGFWSRRID